MVKEKLILDIRFFSNLEETSEGSFQHTFEMPKQAHSLGARIARKLRELGFMLNGYDHVYVNFTTEYPELKVGYSEKTSSEKWFKYFDVGFDKDKLGNFTEVELLDFIEEYTFKVLSFLCDEHQESILEQVKNEISEKKTEVEIIHKQKETKSYEVKITYQIKPNGSDQSRANIYYLDKKLDSKFQAHIDLEFYEDILFLATSVSVKNGYINLKPRSSFKADIYNQRYNVPISIEIA
jgi:hypothetical protein